METQDFEIKDNSFLRQFEATIEEKLVRLEYSEQDRKIFLSKLDFDQELQEKGYQEEFLTKIFDRISEKEKIKVVPTSKVIRKFFRKNKSKYSNLLPIGINI